MPNHFEPATPCHICTRTGLRVPLTCPFRGAAGSKTPARKGARGTIFPNEREKEGTQPEPWMCAISISRDVCTPHPISCVCWRLYACAVWLTCLRACAASGDRLKGHTRRRVSTTPLPQRTAYPPPPLPPHTHPSSPFLCLAGSAPVGPTCG